MKRINVSYVYYFNKKYKRVGHLFQDRFKSEVVEDDSYILALARYIHQNPVSAGMVRSAGDYKWSSYPSYLNEKEFFNKALETDTILGLFSKNKGEARKQFEEYMNEEVQDVFIDMTEESEIMDVKTAKELFEKIVDLSAKRDSKGEPYITEDLIIEFKEKTNLSIRKVAMITGMNKDKVSKMLRG